MAAGITMRPWRTRETFRGVVPPVEARRRERIALFARAYGYGLATQADGTHRERHSSAD